jgi:tetratricopeptide (TPR) repeat protein
LDAPDTAPELADLPELPVEADELAWLNEALEAEEKSGDSDDLEELFAETKKAEATVSDDEKSELPDWMKEDAPAKSEAKAEKDDEELPDWLKGDAEEEKKPEPIKDEKEPEPVPEVKVSDSDELPDWLKGGAEEEPVTAGGGLTAFLQAVEPAAEADKTEEPEVKKPEPEPEPAKAEAKAEPEPAKAAPPPPPPASIPRPIPAGEAGETLKSAREQMSNGELQKALEIYESLVASGHGQDETISDLMEIVKTRAVVNPKVYRVIGDALIGKGEMQEAMEYYKKALDNF